MSKKNNIRAPSNVYEFGSYSNFWQSISGIVYKNSKYSSDYIKDLIKDPMTNNKEIRDLSREIYSSSGLYSNVIDYMTSLMTLDRVIVPKTKSSNKQIEVKTLIETILFKLKDKEFIRDMLWRAMIDGIAVSYFESAKPPVNNQKFMNDYQVRSITEINEADMNVSVYTMPTDYIQIVGIKNGSYIVAFNLDYFNNGSEESVENKLRKYPKEIRQAYQEKQKNNTNLPNWYILDSNKTIVLKIRSSRDEKWGRPLVLQAIQDILYDDFWTDTKRGVLSEINGRIFYMEFPQGKETGSSALTQTQQKKQHELVRDGILKRGTTSGTNFFSVASGTKINKLDVDTSIFKDECEEKLRVDICTDLGFAASLLSGVSSSYSSQQNNLQLVLSQVYAWVESISYELVKVINAAFLENESVYIYYLPCSIVNRKEFVNQMKELYTLGHGSLSAWIASTGINPEAYLTLMQMELDEKWDEKFKPHLTSYTATQNEKGRPESENLTNENTVQSKTNNSNYNPKVWG